MSVRRVSSMTVFGVCSLLTVCIWCIAATPGADLEHQIEHLTSTMAALNDRLQYCMDSDQLTMIHMTSLIELVTSLLRRVELCGPCDIDFSTTRVPPPSTMTPPTPTPTTTDEPTSVDGTWRDEVAQAACTGLMESGGWMFAVRRECSSGGRTCTDICAPLASQDGQTSSMRCIESLHVYAGSHPLERGLTDADVETLGTKVYRYFSCTSTSCGPNFCCCQGN